MTIHAKKIILCLGCPSRFSRHSAMLLHLSAGACVFEMAPEKVNQPAFEYCQAGSYSFMVPALIPHVHFAQGHSPLQVTFCSTRK
jgi:hypothetical protein